MITEKKRQWLKEYRQRNKVHISKVAHVKYIRNREEILRKWKEQYEKNPQHFLAMAKKSRINNKETIKSKWARYYEKYKELKKIRAKTRHTFRHLLKTGSCQSCGSKERLTFHHPTKPYKYDVFQILCRRCHGKIHGQKHFAFDEENEK